MSIKRQSSIFPKFDGNLRPSIMWWTEPVETWEKWPAADPQVLMSFGRHGGCHCTATAAVPLPSPHISYDRPPASHCVPPPPRAACVACRSARRRHRMWNTRIRTCYYTKGKF